MTVQTTTAAGAKPGIREAATLALLRDGAAGPEVLLLERDVALVFGAGAHVYPGGAVDAADADERLRARCASGLAAAERRLGLAYWMAAIRECFEEAGLFVGCRCGVDDVALRERLRAELNAQRIGWPAVCEALDLSFELDGLYYFDHWTTPAGPPKRYSTRFFAARAPLAQQAVCDGSETTRLRWTTPAAALAAEAVGELSLMVPTRETLARMRGFDDVDALLTHLAAAGQGLR